MTIAAAAKIGGVPQYTPNIETSGVSQEAISVTKVFSGLLMNMSESVYLSREYFLPKQASDYLSEIESECTGDNWEEGAVGVKKLTIIKAKEFLKALPKRFQTPEIEAEKNGSISFEWYRNPKQIFVVRINDLGVLKYAGLFGPVKSTRGTSYFDGYVPDEVLELIKRV